MIYVFGDNVELDVERKELRYGGKKLPISFDLLTMLQYLIEHRNRVASWDELVEQGWPKDGDMATPSALRKRIDRLRTFVGDGPIDRIRTLVGDNGKPHMIVSRQGRGFAFVAPVEIRYCGLEGLRALARFSNRIWTLLANERPRTTTGNLTRDLGEGAPEPNVQRSYSLRDHICVALDLDHDCHLVLINEGTTGNIYSLCPSQFARDTWFQLGRSYLPQADSPQKVFTLTGRPGREHLFAIITNEPLQLDWFSLHPQKPARTLTEPDINALLEQLHTLEENTWQVLSTYFDVVGPRPSL